MGVKQNLSTAYHPQTDGQTERVNQEIHAYMRIFVDYHQDDWVDVLPAAVFSYNTKLQSAIGTSPFEMAKGREPNRGTEPAKKSKLLDAEQFAKHMRLVADEARAHLEMAKQDMARHYDAKRKAEEFEVGDKVYVSTKDLATGRPKKKWDIQRIGPYAITKKLSSHAYRILLPRESRIHPVFHISKLTRWIPDEFNRPKPPRVVLNVRGGDWIPEKVLQSRTNKGRLEYQTKWRDQPESRTTWELGSTFKESHLPLLEQFHKEFPDAVRTDDHDPQETRARHESGFVKTAVGRFDTANRKFLPDSRLSSEEKRREAREAKAERALANAERTDAEIARLRDADVKTLKSSGDYASTTKEMREVLSRRPKILTRK
jgi:hypothetical protein